jgi:hypothetical protein
MLVEGSVGVGDGWWLVLDEPYEGSVDEQTASVLLSTPSRLIMPQTTSYDPDSVDASPAGVLADIIDQMHDDSDLTDLGPVTGTGWIGHLFREPIDPSSGEYQLLASLSATGTLLSLAIRFTGVEAQNEALRVVRSTVHDPDSIETMNAQLRNQMGIR